MSGISVARASEAEAAACLALLPQAQGSPAELLVARRDGALAGAAALAWQSWANPAGFPLLVEVVPQARRRGVGRALVAAAAELASGETAGLWSLEPVDVASGAAAFLTACGFSLRRRQHHFEADLETLLASLSPLVARLRGRGRIPAAAEVVPLADGPIDEVGWLVSAEFGGGPFSALRRLRARTLGADDRSIAVVRAGEVCAAMVDRLEGGTLVVDARVVAPAARGDWPNALLLEAAARRALAEGATTFRFHCDDTVSDTLSLARRSAARETAVCGLFYYALSG